MRLGRSTKASSGLVPALFAWAAACVFVASPRIAVGQTPHVAVVHVDPGTYAVESYTARQEAAQQFYSTHRDAYDFIVVFPIFPIDRSASVANGETDGRHFLVRNAVTGIGIPITDFGASFGSPARLQGFIDEYALVPGGGQDLEAALAVVGHEIAHQWSGAARFRDPHSGQNSDALLGLENAHWSYFLDSDASVLYGADWLASAGGTYTAAAAFRRYSALDLYLMGFLTANELGAITLLQPASSVTTPAASLPPAVGTRIAATPIVVTADDLVAAMGPRLPAPATAQGSFRAAFLIAAAPGQDPTPEQLDFVDAVRREWANRFFFMTRGRAVMETELLEHVPTAVASDPSIQLGIDYLLTRQQQDGGWADDPGTQVRDTQAALEALSQLCQRPDVSPALARAAGYLQGVLPLDTDTSARRALALSAAGASLEGGPGALVSIADANSDGGWGLAPGYGSTVIDTALAVLSGASGSSEAVSYLLSVQNADGGWGMLAGSPSDISTTALVLHLLREADLSQESVFAAQRAMDFIRLRHSGGQRYLEEDDGRDRTAEAVLALAEWTALTPLEAQAAVQSLLSQQLADGSWEGSVERTAIAVRALRALMLPNPAVESVDVVLTPSSVSEGEPSIARVRVRNIGHAEATGVVVQAFAASGAPFGPPAAVASIPAGTSAVVNLDLETAGHGGASQAFVVVDPGGVLDEITKADNRAAAAFSVAARPAGPDLYVAAGSLTATPATITRVGSTVSMTARVGNVGLSDVGSATVALLSGSTTLATTTVALAGGSSQYVVLGGNLPMGDLTTQLTVRIDPENSVAEAREDNNQGMVFLELRQTVDLSVHLVSIAPSPVPLGQDVEITFDVKNVGTASFQSARVMVTVLDAAGSVLATLPEQRMTVGSAVTERRRVTWRAGDARAVAVRVEVEAGLDLDPSDNAATGPFAVLETGESNLTIAGAPFITPAPPLEGKPAQLSVRVRNAGIGAAEASALELWLGDPAAGGHPATRVSVPPLAGGEEFDGSLPIAAVPGTPTTLVARVDPDDAVEEYDESDNDIVLYVEPLTRPDLAILDGSIEPSSAFPRRGDRVSVRVAVDNLGGQQAGPALLELFAGAPEAGGVAIGAVQLAAIGPHGRTEAAFEWDTAAWGGTVELVAVVNRDRAAEDARPENDRGARAVLVQAGAVALSNPYISPNGDGVRDSTELFYRIDDPGAAVLAAVRDERGRTIRTLRGTAGADGSGSLLWDGRTDAGRVAYDGSYLIALQAGSTLALAQIPVVVDTNRASVLDAPAALRTPVLLDEMFRALLPPDEPHLSLDLVGLPDEANAIYHYRHELRNGGRECGFYRVPLEGGIPEPFTPPAFPCTDHLRSVLSPDGGAVYSLSYGADYREFVSRYDFVTQTSVALTDPDVTPVGWPFWLRPDGQLNVGTDDGVIAIDPTTGAVSPGVFPGIEPLPSPDGQFAAFVVEGLHGMELHVANADGTGAREVVVEYPHPRCLESYPDGPCIRWEPTPIATPDGAVVLAEDAPLGIFTWVSPTELAYDGGGVWLLDLETGLTSLLAPRGVLGEWVQDLVADPAGRNLAITVHGAPVYAPEVLSVNLASGDLSFVENWSLPEGQLASRFTPFGSALAGEFGCGAWGCLAREVDLFSKGNLYLNVAGRRQAGSPEIVFRGTVADLNLESWLLTAQLRRGGGAPIIVASGSRMIIDAELGRWTAPGPGTWDVTLTGRDLAGNARSVTTLASWADVPPIANLRAAPRYFSPNGDGLQDEAIVSYSVQEPVSATLQITSSTGVVVRSLPVVHASLGEYSVRWDGRDESGQLVPDGTYAIATYGSKAEVTVDTTPPGTYLHIGVTNEFAMFDIRPESEGTCTVPPPVDGQTPLAGLSIVPMLKVGFSPTAGDLYLSGWALEAATAARPDDYFVTYSGNSIVDTRNRLELFAPAFQATGHWFRLVAEDYAGNRSMSYPSTDWETFQVSAFGAAWWAVPACAGVNVLMNSPVGGPVDGGIPLQNLGTSLADAGVMPRLDQMFPGWDPLGNPRSFCYQPAYHAFAFQDTIRAPLIGASVAYSTDNGASWTVDQERVALMPHGAILWDARTAPPQINDLRVSVMDAEGREFSQDVRVQCDVPGSGNMAEVCSTAAGLPSLHLAIQASIRGSARLPGFMLRERVTRTLRPLDLGEPVIDDGPDGTRSYTFTTSIDADALPACEWDVVTVDPVKPSAATAGPLENGHFDICGLSVAHLEVRGDTATASLGARFRDPLSRFDLYVRETARVDGPPPATGEPVLVASLPPFSGLSAPFSFDLGRFGFGNDLTLMARVVHADGTVTEQPIIGNRGECRGASRFSRPGVEVSANVVPLPSPRCAETPSDRIVLATARNRGGDVVGVHLELSAPGLPSFTFTGVPVIDGDGIKLSQIVHADDLVPAQWSATAVATEASGRVTRSEAVDFSNEVSPPWAMYVDAPADGERVCPVVHGTGAYARRTVRVEGEILGSRLSTTEAYLGCGAEPLRPVPLAPVAGALGLLDVSGRSSRDCELVLETRDQAGASYCTAPSRFHLIGGDPVAASVVPGLFSPNGDGTLDLASVSITVSERSTVTVRGVDAKGRSGAALSTAADEGNNLAPWDGALDGVVAADGDVRLRVEAVDPCGTVTSAETVVRVDNTPPMVRIDEPAHGTRVGGRATLTGEVSDENLLAYDVAIGTGSAPGVYQTVFTSERVARGRIGEVPTDGLAPGVYTIRVQARDRAWNSSTATVEVEVTSNQLIRSLAVEPALVSPNHDGLLDASTATYETLAPAIVSLELLAAGSGTVVPVLPPVSTPAGVGEVELPAPLLAALNDGLVTIRLTATAGDLVETEDVVLTLDRIPPRLAIDEPANGAVVAQATNVVQGQVDDDHLENWKLTLFQGGLSSEIAAGSAPRAGVLASMSHLAEGDYGLVLEARDGAGNAATQPSSFSIDRTPPDVALDAPAPESWVTGRKGTVEVRARAVDAHLASVRLEAWAEGAEARELFHGASLPTSGHVADWDVLAEADGPLQLRLEATDAAGNASEAWTPVYVDNTVPVATLSAPRDGFVHPGDPITGVATDQNLERWKLELTAGAPSTISVWVPLAEGTEAVQDDVLTALGALPADGTYGLRLTVVDRAGNEAVDVSSFTVDTTPPRPPTALVATLQGPDVALAWAPSPDEDVVGYVVLRAGATGVFFPVGAMVTDTSAVDPAITDGHHRYQVVAVDRAGLKSDPSEESRLDVDRTPPRVAIDAPSPASAVSGIVSVVGTAFSAGDFKEYRLLVGVGESPTSFTLVRRSGQAVSRAEIGTLDASAFGHGTSLTVRLEAEDLSGNVAEAHVGVVVDAAAPGAPVLVSATPVGSAVQLAWQPPTDPDVLGYVVFRNGTLANAPDGVDAAQLPAYLVPAEITEYVDAGLPDGEYTYEVQAYDRALNASALSNSLTAVVEITAPRATIVAPVQLARLDGVVDVTAEVTDQDVASVQFEVRPAGASSFQALGEAVTRQPFTVALDLAAFGASVLELRAVATDAGGNSDAAPPSTFVFHAPAPAAPDVTAAVTGADVRVTWSDPNPAGTIAGYEVQRDGTSLLPAALPPAGTATASISAGTAGMAYDSYPWSAWTASPSTRPWWRLDLSAPTLVNALYVQLFAQAEVEIAVRVQDAWVPVRTGMMSGGVHVPLAEGLQIDGVRVSFLAGAPTVGLYEVTLDPTPLVPGPTWQDSDLARGTHAYGIGAVSVFGIRGSATASARVYAPVLDAPEPLVSSASLHVTGAGATPGATVTVSRDDVEAGSGLASADGGFSADVELTEGENHLVARATDPEGNVSLPSEPVSVAFEAAPDVALALRLTGVHGSSVELAFDVGGDPSGIAGFLVRRAGGSAAAVVADLGKDVRSVTDARVPNGTYTYTVTAYTDHGIEGAPSNPVEATVAVPPPAAVSSLTVAQVQGYPALRLRWELGVAGDRYLVERALSQLGPFSAVNADRLATGDTYLDAGLTPGVTYFYRVREVDPAGNPGAASPVAWGVPLAGALARPWIFEPVSPAEGWITIPSNTTDVSGIADPGVLVELRSNDVWVAEARAGGAELHAETIVAVWNSRGFGVSPDGETIAYGENCCGTESLHAPGLGVWIEAPGLHSFGRVVFSPDGRWIAFEATASEDGRNHVWIASADDGSFQRIATEPGEERAPAWAPDGTKLAYEVRRDAGPADAIGVLEIASATEQVLGSTSGAALFRPAWTASGEPLALASSVGVPGVQVVRFDGGSWQEVYASDADMLDLVVSPDGMHAALLGDDPGTPVILVDLASGEVTSRDETPANMRRAAFSPDASTLFLVLDGQLIRTSLVTGETELLGFTGPVEVLAGAAHGAVALLETGDVTRYRYGGVFHVPAVPLFEGDNDLVATAIDGEGGRSEPSEWITVTVEQLELADLAVTGVALLPTIPVAGDTVQAVVTIRNIGDVEAGRFTLVVKEVGPDGIERELSPAVIAGLPSGATTSAVVTLGAVTGAGEHEVIALVDAAGAVPDLDRQNNLGRARFTVLASRDLQLSVAADPSSVGFDGEFTARVTVQNPGAPVDATIVTRLADLGGTAVFEAPPTVYQPLAGGSTTSFETVLQAGTALAGDYQVVAILTAAGSAPVIASTPVTIEPEQSATLALSADRFRYAPTSQVNLDAVVTNASRNASLSGATYHLEILGAGGAVTWTEEAPIPEIWTGGATVLSRAVGAATLGAGEFVAHGWVKRQGTVLAEVSTSFTVLATPTLVGTLAVAGQGDPPVVPAGTAAAVTVTFWNAGSADSPATSGRLMFMSPWNAAVLSTEEIAVPALVPGASAAQAVAIPTTGLALATYGLTLVVDGEGTASTLATARFRVADPTPPTLTLQSPAQGAVVPGVVYPWITAQDSASGVALVRASVGAAVTPLTLANGNGFEGIWSASVTLGADGPYTLVFTAADAEGSDGLTTPSATNPITLTVVSDRTPPVLEVDGVADGAMVNAPVVLDVTATDLHLASVFAEIDGFAYTPGTSYSLDGTHVFRAFAVDLAGNTSSEVRVFDLDTIPPDVVIVGVTDGQYLGSAVAPLVLVSDRNAMTHEMTLDGGAWPGDPIAAEGHHLLVVDARDVAGNTRHVETGFWIDLTPPTLAIGGVEEGACSALPVTPVVTAEDANLGAVTATLDGQPFTSGSAVSQDGGHTVAAVVVDLAGHQATDEVSFTIDGVPPVITLPDLDGRFFAEPVTVTYEVTDATATNVQATLDSEPFASGVVVSADGQHLVEVRARDCAGNETSRTATFVIDRTAPTLTLSGVADGAIVSGPVEVFANASDANLTSVVLELDGAPYDSGTPIEGSGDHLVTGVATDAAGNTTRASLGFTLDDAPPQIAVDGVADGDVLGGPVTPIVTVTDENLETWDVTIGGAPLPLGGSVLGEGAHRLVVTARDLAGNEAVVTIDFTIDLTPPSINVGGVDGGVCYVHDVAPTYSVEDAHLASTSAVLNGEPFVSGTVVSIEGDYVLLVSARDVLDNAGSRSTAFVLDKTPPSVVLAELDGRSFAGPVTPSWSATDPHLTAATAQLDGAPFAAGDLVSAEGEHTLTVTAQDCAGNSGTQAALFTIDLTPPLLTLSGVTEAAIVTGPVSISATVSDVNGATLELTLDGAPYTSDTAITAAGPHTVSAVATDPAGNVARASLSFTIDDLPPMIEIAGVSEGELTNEDVVPVVTVTDANLEGWTATLDGEELPASGVVFAEGEHTLLVVARDLAGNEARASRSFEIDRTAPVVVASVEQGVEYAGPLTITFSASDLHLDGAASATLDGAPFASGGTIAAAGPHELIVTAEDLAGNQTSESYGFSISGAAPAYRVTKRLVLDELRVLARVACGATGDLSAAFLSDALPDAHVTYVRNDVDLLVGLRSGRYQLIVLTGDVETAHGHGAAAGDDYSANCHDPAPPCPPVGPVPPLSVNELDRRLAAELTEAVHRGLGLLVFRAIPPAQPWLKDVLGISFLGNEGSGTVVIAQTAISGPLDLGTSDGVALKLVGASGFGVFEPSGKVAAAMHEYGLGAVVVLGFDPAAATGDAASLVTGAASFVVGESALAPGGVVAVRIEVENGSAASTTRVREQVDPSLSIAAVRDGGTLLPDGDAEWMIDQAPGQLDGFEYLLRLPELAGAYLTTSEVARMVAGQVQSSETHSLTVTLGEGIEQLQDRAEQLATALPADSSNKMHRRKILDDLALVRANPGATAEDRENAIGALLDAVDHVNALKGVDRMPLRLAIDSLLAVWEGRR